ncbi:MAG: conjugal transfer protein TraF [Deltaproteobacteria bacterium]|nr:conjugal transfer protein TraF [Deltaproteobacteria bacterium]
MLIKRIVAGAAAVTAAFFISSQSDAREWTIVGPRALGMGGANVAVANDASASYWNPAAYGFFGNKEGGDYGKRDFSGVLDAGLGMQIHENLGEELDKIFKINYDNLDNGAISPAGVSDFLSLVNQLKTFNDNKDRALSVLFNGGLRVQVGRFGAGGYVFNDVSAKGELDLENISPVATGSTFTIPDFSNPANYGCPACPTGALEGTAAGLSTAQEIELNTYLQTNLGWTSAQSIGFVNALDNGITVSGVAVPADIVSITETVAGVATVAAGAGGTFANNTSRLLFKGAFITEVPFTYGHPITPDLAVGGNIKLLKGRIYNTEVKIFNTDFGDALSAATKSFKETQAFGLDLGVLYRFGDNLRLGLVGRNINSPSFEMTPLVPGDEDSFKEKAQYRAGVAYKPLSFVTVALDYDITKNDTTVGAGYKSKNLGGGVELNILKILQLRAGAYKNMAESDIGLVYTVGGGLNLWLVNLDLGASLSSSRTSIDGKKFPEEIKAELAVSALF